MKQVWCQQWEESERGWGTRPDGYSLHLSKEDAVFYSQRSMQTQQEYFRSKGEMGVPDEYDRPTGESYLVEVTDEVFQEVSSKEAQKNQGKRYSGRDYPKPVSGKAPTGTWGPMKS